MKRASAVTTICLLALLSTVGAPGRPALAQSRSSAALTREEYAERLGGALDDLIRRLRAEPRRPVLFSANLFFAHGAAVGQIPLETLIAYADGLREAGARRIDINLSIAPWRDGDVDTIAKYDALVSHIRASSLQLAFNPAYNATTDEGGFEAWAAEALRLYPEIARRYRPDVFVVVHEPTTQARRMGEEVSPARWAAFVEAAVRGIRSASPETLCGAGLLHWERAYLDPLLAVADLDAISFDVYDLRGLPVYGEMIRTARAAGKRVWMEETWRPPYVAPGGAQPRSLEELSGLEIGNAAFEALDAKWLEALSLYAGAMGLEAFTPFWTQTFFLYVRDGQDGALDPAYNARVIRAIQRGERTRTFDAYRRLAAAGGTAAPPTAAALGDAGGAARSGEKAAAPPRYRVERIRTIQRSGGRVDWSAADGRIAFDKPGSDGYFDVYLMDPDGGDERCLTCRARELGPKHKGNPAWHPSGRWVVFQVQKPEVPRRFESSGAPGAGALNDLWIASADGTRFFELYSVPYRLRDAPGVLHPHFSHDGRRLLWSERVRGGGAFGIWELRLAEVRFDAGRVRLENVQTLTPGEWPCFYESHGFSPDDSRILFSGNLSRGQPGPGLDIYELELSTRRLIRLTASPTEWDEHAQYSPDGRSILWMSSRGVPGGLVPSRLRTEYWIMDRDGGNPYQLTFFHTRGHPHSLDGEGVVAADSAWSPDGRRLVALLIEGQPEARSRGEGRDVMIELTEAAETPR